MSPTGLESMVSVLGISFSLWHFSCSEESQLPWHECLMQRPMWQATERGLWPQTSMEPAFTPAAKKRVSEQILPK